jgi:two-component system, chemotaxis family, protein-glutamate methylesterase/glutaminase
MNIEAPLPACVIGIGASAGGVDALTKLVAGLPADFPHAILVVLHLPAGGRSLLGPILDRHCVLPVETAYQGAKVVAGRIFTAPPDRHLLVRAGHIALSRGPKENAARPSVDTALRSIAEAYGPRSAAVILSGALGDGSHGALAIAQAGGTVIIQDPDDALVPSMPETALRTVGEASRVLPVAEIGAALAQLSYEGPDMYEEVSTDTPADPIEASRHRPRGAASGFTCPECSGALWELREGNLTRFRCRVGHTYSDDAMLAEQGDAVEAALWAALEVLEERAELLERMAERPSHLHSRTREKLRAAASDALERGELIRRALGAARGPDAFALADDGGAR